MATKINKDEMFRAVKALDLIPTRAGVPSSDYVRLEFKKKEIYMALASVVIGNVHFGVEDKLPDEKPFLLDRRLLFPFLVAGEKMKADFLLENTETMIRLSQGNRKAEFEKRAEDIGGYGKWRDYGSMKEVLLSDTLKTMLTASASCSTADPALPELNCVYVKKDIVMATNYVIMFRGDTQDNKPLEIPFPINVVPLLKSELVKGVGIVDGKVILDCTAGFIEGVVPVKAQTKFPKETVAKQMETARKWPITFSLKSKQFSQVIDRLQSYLAGARRQDWMLSLETWEDGVRCRVKIQQGVFQEKIAYGKHNCKPGVSLMWSLEWAGPVLQEMTKQAEEIVIRYDEKADTAYHVAGGQMELMIAKKVK
jgi:hypothetical protein